MKGILGVKVGMTQVFDDQGVVTPVTIIQAGPCYVTQVKTIKSDGYNALQVGFDEIKEKRLTKGQQGHLGLLSQSKKRPQRKKSSDVPALRVLREFRIDNPDDYKVGQVITASTFELGDRIDVTGKAKGRGYTGVVKRWGFAGGSKTHGQSDRWRAPGSIGATSGTAHVFKGKKMAGRTGNNKVTAQNLEVIRIDTEKNLIAVKGAIPGAKGGLVTIQTAMKG